MCQISEAVLSASMIYNDEPRYLMIDLNFSEVSNFVVNFVEPFCLRNH